MFRSTLSWTFAAICAARIHGTLASGHPRHVNRANNARPINFRRKYLVENRHEFAMNVRTDGRPRGPNRAWIFHCPAWQITPAGMRIFHRLVNPVLCRSTVGVDCHEERISFYPLRINRYSRSGDKYPILPSLCRILGWVKINRWRGTDLQISDHTFLGSFAIGNSFRNWRNIPLIYLINFLTVWLR